jgi:putative holliday junction resolvase
MQIVAFDFGTKKIGVAIGQPVTQTAQPLDTLYSVDGGPPWPKIQALFDEWQPEVVVVGLPLNMDGTEQEISRLARRFSNRIAGRFDLKVELQDERLTSAEARQIMFDRGGVKRLQKSQIDSIAACLILEDWFKSNAVEGQ